MQLPVERAPAVSEAASIADWRIAKGPGASGHRVLGEHGSHVVAGGLAPLGLAAR
jgi:hypothetical protein